jgi:hypothetical protein
MLIFDKFSRRWGQCWGQCWGGLLLGGFGGVASAVLLPAPGNSVVFAPALRQQVAQSMAFPLTQIQPTGMPSSGTQATPSPGKRPVLVAQQSRWQRVRFAAGASAITIKDSVLRGTRDVYLVDARQQQKMTIQLTSLENNATFDVIAPPNRAGKRVLLRQAVMTWTGTLPQSGDYRIVVGPTRGNASYRLVISIK